MEVVPEPVKHLHVRITPEGGHSELQKVIDCVCKDVDWYIIFPHFGKNGDNEHFHVFAPDLDKAGKQCLRRRIASHFGSGNAHFIVESRKDGIGKAIQYGSREGTDPTSHGAGVLQWIADAPPWVPGGVKRRRVRTFEDDQGNVHVLARLLNVYNVLPIMVIHFRLYRAQINRRPYFAATIKHMIRSGRYQFHRLGGMLDRLVEHEFNVAIGFDPEEELNNVVRAVYNPRRLAPFDVPDSSSEAPETPFSWGEEDPEA